MTCCAREIAWRKHTCADTISVVSLGLSPNTVSKLGILNSFPSPKYIGSENKVQTCQYSHQPLLGEGTKFTEGPCGLFIDLDANFHTHKHCPFNVK